MLAKQISKNGETFCTADTPLTTVFHKMSELGCRCMPVVESLSHRNVIGCITEHDICRRLIDGELNPKRANAERVMSGNFTTVSGDASLEECRELLMLAGAEQLFVVDENSAFIGILTADELDARKASVTFETVIKEYIPATGLSPKVHLAY